MDHFYCLKINHRLIDQMNKQMSGSFSPVAPGSFWWTVKEQHDRCVCPTLDVLLEACWDAQHAHRKQKNICAANTARLSVTGLPCVMQVIEETYACATASWWRLSYVLDNVGCVTANAAWGETRFLRMIHPSCKEAVWTRWWKANWGSSWSADEHM